MTYYKFVCSSIKGDKKNVDSHFLTVFYKRKTSYLEHLERLVGFVQMQLFIELDLLSSRLFFLILSASET